MPSWNDVLHEVTSSGSVHDIIRRKYLAELHAKTGRNVIAYYSAWLQKAHLAAQGVTGFEVNDSDKNGFMARSTTWIAVRDSISSCTRRGVIWRRPSRSSTTCARCSVATSGRSCHRLAMSAGTMIALSCRTVVMGKHSSLGPIDPQIFGVPAHGVVEEFKCALQEVKDEPSSMAVWQPIIAKYSPTLIGECEKAIKWSDDIVRSWLMSGMFEGHEDGDAKASRILGEMAITR
jgi:Serine dehydrogenase proteinase